MKIHQSILYGESILSQVGIENSRWNSERLLSLALQQPRTKIYADLNHELTEQEQQSFEALLQKRAQQYPLAYLECTQEFFGRQFFVSESVLIPRPETEGIVQAVLDLRLNAPSILDIGAGSGAIAVTLALEIPNSHVFALELSSQAISVLEKNVTKWCGRQECSSSLINIVRADFAAMPFFSQKFDVITANLPYVETDDFANLPAETKWEPRMALFTPSLEETYLGVVRQSATILKPGGYLVLEIGFGQSERLQKAFAAEAMRVIDVRTDQQNIPRVMILTAKPRRS